jgi:hypothetical protein
MRDDRRTREAADYVVLHEGVIGTNPIPGMGTLDVNTSMFAVAL